MTEAASTEPGASRLSAISPLWPGPAARRFNVDLLAVLIAILLPWSTSGVVIGMALWLVAVAATLDIRAFVQSLRRPVCVLPIALFVLAVVGTLWSEGAWSARLYAV